MGDQIDPTDTQNWGPGNVINAVIGALIGKSPHDALQTKTISTDAVREFLTSIPREVLIAAYNKVYGGNGLVESLLEKEPKEDDTD